MIYTKADLISAKDRLKLEVINTPILRSEYLNDLIQSELFFKCENFQKGGAFKFRGATNAVKRLLDSTSVSCVATHSSGNHGRALAMAAKKNGLRCIVVVPENAPKIKVEGMRREGAEIHFCESTIIAREQMLRDILLTERAEIIPPYNHPNIIMGQSTCAQEIIDEIPNIQQIICPVGGGGLLSGTALAAKYFGKNIEVFAGEPERADDAFRSLKTGEIQPVGNPNTIADGLRTYLGTYTFEVIKQDVKEIFLVSEQEILDAMRMLWSELKVIIEPSCAVPFAAILRNKEKFKGKSCAVILSGGNVDLERKYF